METAEDRALVYARQLAELRAVAAQLADALRAWVYNGGSETVSVAALARYADAVDER